MSVELTIETVEETIVLELQDNVPPVLTIDHIPDLRDELDAKVDAEAGMGLSELSFTTVDKLSLDQSEQDRHTHSNKTVIDDLSDDSGVLQYKGLPISDQAALDAKVDKVAGKGLSDENYTLEEKNKLAGLESSRFKGVFTSLANLQDGVTAPQAGDYADVDAGVGDDVVRFIWDATDSAWVVQQSATTITAAQVKQMYESNPDTNVFDDDEKYKLATVQENATANRADSENADKIHGHAISDVTGLDAALLTKFDKADIAQVTGPAADKVMSQKAVTELTETVDADVDALDVRLTAVEALTAVSSVTWDMATDTYTGSPKVTLVHKNMRRCVINNQAQVQYYLDEFDSTKKEDGTPADLSGADGQVVVEINPVYVRRSFVGSKMTTELTHAPLPGFKLHEAFSGGVLKHYIGAYQATVWSVAGGENLSGLNSDNNLPRIDLATDYLTSLPDSFAMVGVSRTNFRTLAQNGGYQLYDYWQWELLKDLFIAEFGNWNSQAVLGRGNVDGAYPAPSDVQSDSPHTMNGLSNSLGNNSGSSATNPFVSYRGIENPWGNAWQWVDGVNILERQLRVSNDETLYNDNDETGYVKLGVPLPTTNGYIKEWQKIANGFLPAVTGGGAGAATFIGDYLYTSAGRRALRVGGHASTVSNAGLCCAFGLSAASYSALSLSARLSKKLRA